jgi:hypothetical protein
MMMMTMMMEHHTWMWEHMFTAFVVSVVMPVVVMTVMMFM